MDDPAFAHIVDTEVKLALADWACRESTDYAPEQLKVRFAVESQSISQTLKGQLDLELPGGRTPAGVSTRIAQRLLALVATIWYNDQIRLNVRRSLTAHDH
ncbi:MAG: hypothetical protein VB036_16160 [Propionicimonas sp.]|nr:hypothetical protein [Propionicimonas sp.]